jgi:RNA polymerase sigma factor (sigma-70 family)
MRHCGKKPEDFKPGTVDLHPIRVMTAMAWTADRIRGVQTGANDSDQSTGDTALARQAAAGDARAFERLYRAHVGRVYGLCIRLVDGDRAKAEQFTQDAFVRAWEKLASFRGEAQFSTWLHRLTVNLVLGEHRLMRRWVSFDDHVAAGEDDEAGDAAAFGEHPQQRIGERIDLERALAKLPKGARAVLLLHDVEGYRHDEIAALTGIAVGTSKAQLHRARKLMKEWLT